MQKKSNIFKRAWSIILSFTLVCGMLVFYANAAEGDSFDTLASTQDVIVVKGEIDGVYDYANLKTNDLVKVHYSIYMDGSDSAPYAGIGTLAVTFAALKNSNGDKVMEPVIAQTIPTSKEGVALHSTGSTEYPQESGNIYFCYMINDDNSSDILYYGWADKTVGRYLEFDFNYKVSDGAKLTELLSNSNNSINLPIEVSKDGKGAVIPTELFDSRGWDGWATTTNVKVISPEFNAEETYAYTYDFGEGKLDDGNGNMVAPEAKSGKVVVRESYEVAVGDYAGLKYVDSNEKTMVLKHWTVTEEGSTGDPQIIARDADATAATITPNANFTVAAVYAESADGDDIPDDEQVTITYKVRERDKVGVTGIDFGANATDVVANESAKVRVLKDKEIGTLPTVQTNEENKWYFNDPAKEEAGFYVGTDKIDATFAPAADTEIEIRLVKDANGDNIDDETAVVAKVTYEGVEKGNTGENKVPQDAKYTVVVGDTEIASGNANAGVIALTEAEVPYKNADHYPVANWTVEAVDTTEPADGVYDEVKITVTYGNELDTTDVTPGKPIIDGTDGDEEKEPSTDPVKLEKRTNVVFIDGDDKDTANVLEIVEIGDEDPASIPEEKFPASYVAGETENTEGNKFVAWVLKGNVDPKRAYDAEPTHEKEAYHKNYYLMVPKFEKPAQVKIEKAGKDGKPNTTIAENLDIAIGKEIKVVNENNQPITVQIQDGEGNDIEGNKVTGTGTVVVPNTIDENIPVKKGDDYFKGNWDATKDANGDVILSPKFEKLNPGDVEITPVEPVPNNYDDDTTGVNADGEGYKILKGQWIEDNVARAYFKLTLNGKPLKGEEAFLHAVPAPSYTFAGKRVSFGGLVKDEFTYDPEKEAYWVEYNMTRSGVVTLSMTYEDELGNIIGSKKFHVILVGDITHDTYISQMDSGLIARYAYNTLTKPATAAEGGNFDFELMDMSRDGKITQVDAGLIARMAYKTLDSNSPERP